MWKFICPKFLLICLYFTINISMGIVNRDGALYMATGVDTTGLYAGRREVIGIIKAMAGQITSFDVFSGIGISAATAFASAAKSSYDFEKEFQKNMLEVATISTQVEGSMTDFMNQVMAITQEIPIKAPEAAKALYQIVSAGHDGADGMKVLEVSARSAIGGMTDTATAADAITTLINAYKLSADDAEKVSDQLFTTARLGKTTFGELGQSIAQVAPIAASYGVEMDQVLAAVATLTKSGTPTAQAMTQIRAAIIGVSKYLGDGVFNAMTFQEAMDKIAKEANGSESALRGMITEVEAVNGVLGMTGIKAQDAAADLKAMNESAGSTEAAFKLMMNDVDKQMTLLSNNIQAALRPMGQAILKEVSEVATVFNEAFEDGDAEHVIKSLGDLVLILAGAVITYKGAILASTAAQKINVAILRQTVLERKMENMAVLNGVVGHQKLTTAQLKAIATRKMVTSAVKVHTAAILKNVAAMATNPYVLAAAALTTLGVVLYQNFLKATEAEKAQKRLNDAVKDAEKGALSEQRELAKLKGELSATTKGTDEYSKIRDKIVANYGKYDKNLKNEIDTVGLLDETYKKLTISIQQSFGARQYEKFIQDQGAALDDVMSDNLNEIYDKLIAKWGEEAGTKYYTEIKNALMAGEKIPEHLNDIVHNMYGIWAQSLHNYIDNIKDAQKATEDADRKARVKFGIVESSTNGKQDGGDGTGTGAENTPVVSTVIKEITAARNEVNKLKKELADLRSGKTTVDAGKTVQAAIEAKATKLKKAEDTLATLTGQSTKDSDKRLSVQQELARAILDSELKLQAGRIAAMEDGKAKRIALAEQEYRETVATIQKEKEEYKKKIKETKGKEDPVVLSSFDNRETAAGDKKNTDVAKVEKEYTEEYKRRTKELTSVFLNEEQRKLTAVKDRYDQERKWADEQLRTGGMSKEEHKDYTSTIDKAQIQDNYNILLDSLNDYKHQEKVLREKWDTDINAAVEAKDAYLVAKLMEGKEKALSALNSQMLQESSEWMRLFGNLDTLTVTELNNLIDSIQKQLDSGTLSLKPVDAKALMDSLNEAKEKVAEKSPFQALSKSSGEMKKALADLKQAEDDGLTGEQLDVYKKRVKDSAENVKKSIAAIGDAYNQVSDVMKSAADLISMVDEGLGETVNNAIALGDAVMNVGSVVAQAVISFAAGMNAMESASVILLVIKAVLMAVMAAISLFNGDKKHEKKIKSLQEQVDALERAYDKLGRTIGNTFSNKVFEMMDQQEKNLRKQQELIRQQMQEEKDKKKTDKDKVKEYEDKLIELDNKIEDSKQKQIDMLAGTDVQSAIDDFADALIEAYAKGDDAADALGETTKNILANAVKEALKKKFLGDALQKAVTQLGEDMRDGELSSADRKNFEDAVNTAGKNFTEAMKMYDDLFKGEVIDLGTTSDSLADSIIEGLKAGKSGIKDFTSSFEDMMKTAIMNSLKTKYLEGPLKEFQKKFSELSESGGQLTASEIEELRNMYANIIEGAKVQFDGLKEISGLDFTEDSDNTLKGAYAKASQESIDLLAGQTGAQRVAIESIREQMQFIYNLQVQGWKDVKDIKEFIGQLKGIAENIKKTTDDIKDSADDIKDTSKRTAEAVESTLNVKVKM